MCSCCAGQFNSLREDKNLKVQLVVVTSKGQFLVQRRAAAPSERVTKFGPWWLVLTRGSKLAQVVVGGVHFGFVSRYLNQLAVFGSVGVEVSYRSITRLLPGRRVY